MTAMLILLGFLLALGLASALGWTADTRDPEFGMGAFFRYADRLRRR